MNTKRSWTTGLRTVFAAAFVCSVGYLAVSSGSRWWCLRGTADQSTSEVVRDVAVETMLSESESSRVRELVRQMVNPSEATEAVAQLRDHLDQLAREGSKSSAPSMAFFLQCLSARFASLDSQTRQLSLAMMSDIFGWFGQHESACWTALLTPSGLILRSSLSDSSNDVSLAGLQMIRACWDWVPPGITESAHKKALGTWKAELHSQCVELLRSTNEKVRSAAGITVVSVPIDSAAARGLGLLNDPSPLVRRTLLIALSDRSELLANEDVVTFLRDSSAAVRTAAETVLTSRGLSAEQVSLAKRATDPSPLVRAQAPRHIVESQAIDRGVWLSHLSRDVDAIVRTEAARALASVGDEDCLHRLGEMAEADPNDDVRQLAQSLVSEAKRIDAPLPGEGEELAIPPLRTPRAN